MFSKLVLLSLLPIVAFSQNLLRFEAKTAGIVDAQMTLGTIDVEIYLPDFTMCRMINIKNNGVNFQQGVIDVFEGYDLQDCRNITIPNHEIGMITLIHSGTDAWTPEWISLLFDDSTYIMCPDNEGQLDNNMSHDLYNCY